MKVITTNDIKRIMPKCPDEYADALITEMMKMGINTVPRASAFLAQLAHESIELTHVSENLNYSAENLMKVFKKYFPDLAIATEYQHKSERIANKVYANRMGNGDEASGDGWKYHGRGPIQLTGKNNYLHCGVAVGIPFLELPDLVLVPINGIRSAGWYWRIKSLNQYADEGDMATITKLINGGMLGFDERMKYYNKALEILGEAKA